MELGDSENPDYYRAQYRAKLLPLIRELRGADEESVSSFMCLLKKKKEFRCMENVLDENEGVFTERMEGLAERWRDLHARRAQLKAHVKTSGKTVQENEALRNQALKKAIKDKEQNIKRESELLIAQRELEVLRKQHQKLCKKLPKYSMFKNYLEDVVEISQFQDLEEIISFYKALVRSRKDLLQSQQWHKELTEQAKVLLGKYRAEKTADMLRCKNELAQLKQGLDKFRSDIPLWEDRWTDIQSTADKNTMMLKTIRGTIHNLFQSASARLSTKWKVAANDSHRQLDMIQEFIEDLSEISMEDIKKFKGGPM